MQMPGRDREVRLYRNCSDASMPCEEHFLTGERRVRHGAEVTHSRIL
jgi:hypothetical protein